MNTSRIAQYMTSGKIRNNVYDERWNLSFTYVASKDTLYVRTEIGCWKIIWIEELGGYILYHMNRPGETVSIDDLLHGGYHRQVDVCPGKNIKRLLKYIESHDRAKALIAKEHKNQRRTGKRKASTRGRGKNNSKTLTRHYVMALNKLKERESDLMLKNAGYAFSY